MNNSYIVTFFFLFSVCSNNISFINIECNSITTELLAKHTIIPSYPGSRVASIVRFALIVFQPILVSTMCGNKIESFSWIYAKSRRKSRRPEPDALWTLKIFHFQLKWRLYSSIWLLIAFAFIFDLACIVGSLGNANKGKQVTMNVLVIYFFIVTKWNDRNCLHASRY